MSLQNFYSSVRIRPVHTAPFHTSFGEFRSKVGGLSQRLQSKFRLTSKLTKSCRTSSRKGCCLPSRSPRGRCRSTSRPFLSRSILPELLKWKKKIRYQVLSTTINEQGKPGFAQYSISVNRIELIGALTWWKSLTSETGGLCSVSKDRSAHWNQGHRRELLWKGSVLRKARIGLYQPLNTL